MPFPYHIRPMHLDDVDRIVAIERRSFPTPWPAAGYRYELTQNEQAHYVVLTRTASGAVIGYAGHWLIAGEAHVSIIAVALLWRGRGLGEWLLQHMLATALAQDATLATLEVRESNTAAQALYRKYRFDVVGRRPGYYKDTGEAAVLMTVPLDAAYGRWLRVRRAAVRQRLATEELAPAGYPHPHSANKPTNHPTN